MYLLKPNFVRKQFTHTTTNDSHFRITNDKIAQQLGIKKPSDWYNEMHKAGISNLVDSPQTKSPYHLLSLLYPEYKWLPWKFSRTPHGFWNDINNQKSYLTWLSHQLNFKDKEDWYKLTKEDLVQQYGGGLLRLHGDSQYQLLNSVFSDYEWLPWRFNVTPKYFWGDLQNQRKFLDWLQKKMELKDLTDFYTIKKEDLIENGGNHLLQMYSGSYYRLLSTVYPEYKWLPWKFKLTPKFFWEDPKNCFEFLEWSKPFLYINEEESWVNVSSQDLQNLGGPNVPIKELLQKAYPEVDWVSIFE